MKIGIIGMGWVGSSVAISTLHAGIARELWLNDIDAGLAEGEAMDLRHGASFYPSASIGTASVEEMRDADAVVIAAGRGGAPGESRLELLRDTARIARSLGEALSGARGLVIVVSNPVDVLTRIVQEASGLPPQRVIGTGTMLDTARLRQVIGRELRLDPRSIHAQVLGEHGDSEVVAWSSAHVGGRPLRQWPQWSVEREQAVATEVRVAAHEIIARKGATNHAIGLVTAALLRWTLRGERRVLTVSRRHEGPLGLRGTTLSLPVVVGREGATEVVEPMLEAEELAALHRSAAVLERAYASSLGDPSSAAPSGASADGAAGPGGQASPA
ncbi:lactate/malate family dehydrogenase [Paraliomyxa miuraensis]|uniref:lactate/malate family dehydrogenase n=1 Tax=Paraliomyxa miuraensis TaxID=376150 RepID=UPI002255BE56|nr:L-lactate dehydrogenase [Paraliomyxa miuraensis]MCX4242142.1 L-lactate dehydrogenase [Paraliomyxa miuraensis]